MGGLDFGDGGDSDKRKRYLLLGGLALIVVCSLGFTIWYMIAPRVFTAPVPKEHHMFCLTCNKDVVVPLGRAPASHSVPRAAPGAPPGGPPGAPSTAPAESQREVCPICGKPTLIQERICPKCKHYYVTEWDKTHGPMEVDPKADEFRCPNCGVNIAEYRNAHPYDD